MAINEVLRVSPEGEVTHQTKLSDLQRASKIGQIIEQIKDPNAPLAPIKRLIAEEIAVASEQIIAASGDLINMSPLDASKVKALESLVKTLRELGKELMESDILSKKDILNFDGPKLGYVLEEFRQGAIDTLKKIGIDDGTVQQFLRQWRDLMMEREPQIRKATEKLEFETEKK